jgi:predicted DNA-binding antitoxin AbrB/MazE fold protein
VAPAAGEQRVRAIYEAGVLKPLEKLDVTDGEEVEVEIRRKTP